MSKRQCRHDYVGGEKMSMEILEDNAVSELIMVGVCIGVLVGIAFVRIRMRKEEEELGGEKMNNIQLQEAINEII